VEKAEAEEEKAAKDKRLQWVWGLLSWLLWLQLLMIPAYPNVQLTLKCNKSHASIEQLQGKRLERGVGLWDLYSDFWGGSIYMQ